LGILERTIEPSSATPPTATDQRRLGSTGPICSSRKRLEDGNAEFRKTMDPILLRRLASKHEPWIATLSCADARVCPGRIFNLSTGDSYDVRVVGNSASDKAVLASVEYAGGHLGVRALIVIGHTQCCAATAAAQCDREGLLEVISADMVRAKAMLPPDRQGSADDIAEANVRLQLRLLLDNSQVVREAVHSDRLTLMGAMLDLSTGKVKFI